MAGDGSVNDTLGDRIRARRGARLAEAAVQHRRDDIAVLHERIDKLISDNDLKT